MSFIIVRTVEVNDEGGTGVVVTGVMETAALIGQKSS